MSLNLEIEAEKLFCKLKNLNFSDGSIEAYRFRLKSFYDFLTKSGIKDARDFGINDAENYLIYLQKEENKRDKKDNKGLNINYVNHKISVVSKLFEFLEEEEKILINPFVKLTRPKKQKSIPRDILTIEEVERLEEEAEKLLGFIWKCVIETIYGTGVRLSELLNLKPGDIDLKTKVLYVRLGKGKKDRIIPIPEKTSQVLIEYVKGRKSKSKRLFDVSKYMIWKRFNKLERQLKLRKEITPHGLRHTYATHLLEAGADIRIIQMLLGHSFVNTTEIYTKVGIKELREVYLRTHPRA